MFSINLLRFSWSEIALTGMFFELLLTLWLIYYVYANNITIPDVSPTDKKSTKDSNTQVEIYKMLYSMFIVIGCMLNFMFFQRLNSQVIFYNNIIISNITFNYLCLVLIMFTVILFAGVGLYRQSIVINSEYILIILLVIFFAYILISSSNLMLAVFLIEMIGFLIFLKFALNNGVKKSNNATKVTDTIVFVKKNSFGLFNALFFQFWAGFISAIFLFFSTIHIHYLFGTSKFYFVNFLVLTSTSLNYYPSTQVIFVFSVLAMALFIKIGVAPYQFFKIETYKGVPLFMVLVYTILYMFIYIFFFIYISIVVLPTFKKNLSILLLMGLTIGILYMFSLLFDTTNFKAFLSYSTLINVFNILVVVLI